MPNYSSLIKLIKNRLLTNNEHLNNLYKYAKKVKEFQNLNEQSDFLLVDMLNKSLGYKDFGDYERLVHKPYKNIIYTIKNNSEILDPNNVFTDIMDDYLEKMPESLLYGTNNKIIKNNVNKEGPLFRARNLSNENNRKFYEDEGDYLLQNSGNEEDLKLLSDKMGRKEDNLLQAVIKEKEDENISDTFDMINNGYISDSNEQSNALQQLLVQKQKDKLYNQYRVNQMFDYAPEYPVKHLNIEDYESEKRLKEFQDFLDGDNSVVKSFEYTFPYHDPEYIKSFMNNKNFEDNLDDIFEINNLYDFYSKYDEIKDSFLK